MEGWESWSVPRGTLAAYLAPNETIVASQDGVGLYDQDKKVPERMLGTIVLTSNRLAYIDARDPQQHSCFVRLEGICETEHYSGFLNSSPKVTIKFRQILSQSQTHASWICSMCGFSNTQKTSLDVCTLCGVARSSKQSFASQSDLSTSVVPQKNHSSHIQTTRPKESMLDTLDFNPTISTQIPCPACTFLNHPALSRCEICDTQLQIPSSKPTATNATVTPISQSQYSKISFRAGGDKAFYAQLRTTLKSKPWKNNAPRTGAGIHAALSTTNPAQSPTEAAFQSLETLRQKAKQMVEHANSIRTQLEKRERLLESQGEHSSDETGSMIQSELVQLGLAAPAITPDMVKSEREYHIELARELAGLITQSKTMIEQGILALDEVWGLWNRARGTALVSPKVFRNAVNYLAEVTEPRISLRVLHSGRTVLQTARFENASFQARLFEHLDEPKTSLQLALKENLPLALLTELLHTITQETTQFVQDDCDLHDTRWFRNTLIVTT